MNSPKNLGNICYIIRSLKAAGAEKYVLDLASCFSSDGNIIYVIVLGSVDQMFLKRYDLHNIKIIYLPMLKLLSFRALFVIWKISRLITKLNISLVHCNMLVPDIIGGSAAVLAQCPFVSTQHDTQPWRYNRTLKALIYKHVHRYIMKYVSAIIAPSQSVKVYMRETENIDPRKIKVVYHGIYLDQFQMSHRRNLSHVKIGSLGRFFPEKGQLYTLYAFANIIPKITKKTIELVFAGDGPDLQMLINKTREIGIENSVRFLGKIYDVPQFLEEIDILVHSAVSSEAFCYAVLEGLAAGKAVVATHIGGIPEFIKDNHNGILVPPTSVELLSSALIKLVNNDILRFRIGRTAAYSCRPFFSTDRMNLETRRVYEKVLASIKN